MRRDPLASRGADDAVVVRHLEPDPEVALERRAEVGGPHRLPFEYRMPGLSWKVYDLPPSGRRRQRDGQIRHELRPGDTGHLVEGDEPVVRHPQVRP